MVQIIVPHGRRLLETAHKYRGHQNGTIWIWHSHARHGRTCRWDSLTEAVTKYAKRATQAEELMAQMEAKFKKNSTTAPANIIPEPPPPHATYLTQQQQPLPYNPPANISILAPQPHQQHQDYHPTSKKISRQRKVPLRATGSNRMEPGCKTILSTGRTTHRRIWGTRNRRSRPTMTTTKT